MFTFRDEHLSTVMEIELGLGDNETRRCMLMFTSSADEQVRICNSNAAANKGFPSDLSQQESRYNISLTDLFSY